MGASESTKSSNGTKEEDDDPYQENNRSGGSSMGTVAAIAAVAAAGVAVAWGISKVFSDGIKHKMNTDGGCSLIYGERGPGYYGGILQNPRGECVRGFKGYIEESDTLKSALFAVLKGLELLVKLKLIGSILETNSQAAYQFVNGQDEYCGKSKFIQECQSIIEKWRKLGGENRISFNLVSRDNNQCTDKLANMGKRMRKQGYVEINDLPDELKDLV